MATGGRVPSRQIDRSASEHVSQRICQLCLESDNLIDAARLCVDCHAYLCLKCLDSHKVHQHRVLDIEQIMHGQTKASPEDVCVYPCPVHENEVIQYYCANHCHLGCKSCINLDHATCDEVRTIPLVSKKLVNNEYYRQVETQLKSVLDTFINILRNTLQYSDEVEKSCEEALRELHNFRRQMEEALENVEFKLKENLKTLRLKAEEELADMRNKCKAAHKDLQSSLAKIESLQNDNQNYSSYIELMRTQPKINHLEYLAHQAVVDISHTHSPIKFFPNGALLELLKNPEGFGTVYSAGTRNVCSGSDEPPAIPDTDTGSVSSWSDDFTVITDTESMISRPRAPTGTLLHGSDTGSILSGSAFGTQDYHLQELNVKTDHDYSCVTGMVVLSDSRLVLTEHTTSHVKAVDLHTGQVVAQRLLSSRPWDIASIDKNELVVTIPHKKRITFLRLEHDKMRVCKTLTVGGKCLGVDYKNSKLAVSFINPHKVKVLNLKGHVLYSIKGKKSGEVIFNYPCYLNFSQGDTMLYVSNFRCHNVLCVKVDGTVVATYKETDLRNPGKAVVDSSGNIYVCARGTNTIHQITKDCKKLRVQLTQADGLDTPWSLCLSEAEDKLYVGMLNSDYMKVYRVDRNAPQ